MADPITHRDPGDEREEQQPYRPSDVYDCPHPQTVPVFDGASRCLSCNGRFDRVPA